MRGLDQFPLEAEISLTEFRSQDTVTSRLRSHHRLRVRRRGDLIGVFLDVREWRQLVEYVSALEREADRREDEAALAVIHEREPGARFEAGSASRTDAIEREYTSLVRSSARRSRGKRS